MEFYVYTLAYPDGRVFYVGKGKGDRINTHEKEAQTGKRISNTHKVNVIRKIWAGGGEVVKEKVFETDDEQEAFYMEREYISYFGRSNLTNLTDGGEGISGFRFQRTPEEAERIIRNRADNLLVYLRDFEKWVDGHKEPIFDRISRTKLYPMYWEEPEGYRQSEADDFWEQLYS